MLGRRLDRYVGSFFIWHFALCLLAIVGVYTVIDTFAKLEDFTDQDTVWEALRWIVVYHAHQIPVLLTQFFPLVTLLAGVISVARLARYNELNAIKAVGVSVHRALLPVFLVSILVALLAAANQEFLVPSMADDIIKVRMMMRQKDVYRDISAFDRKQRSTVWVKEFQYSAIGYELAGVSARPKFVQAGNPAQARPQFRNARALWAGRWLFLSDGEMLGPDGKWAPFEYKSLATKDDAATFTVPRKPRDKPRSASPGVVLEAEHDARPFEVTFASSKHKGAIRLLTGAQLTTPLSGEGTTAPIAIKAAVWRDNRWLGRATTYEMREGRRYEVVYDGSPLPFAVPPQDLIRSEGDPTLKSFRELLDYTNAPPALRQQVMLALHSRVAFPLASVVLLLVAIPLLFQQEGGKSTWVGMGLGLFVSVCFYFVNYTCQLAGQHESGVFASAPAVAAWLPILLFAAAGGVLLARMET